MVRESALHLEATREALSCVVKSEGSLLHFTLHKSHLGASGNAGSNSGGVGPRAAFLTVLLMTLVTKLKTLSTKASRKLRGIADGGLC